MYKLIAKPLLFLLPPEKAHHFTVSLLKTASKIPLLTQLIRAIYNYSHPSLKKEVMGMIFENPIGLAAGFDKDGELVEEFENLGFGFTEIGTVTPKPQSGNAKPRLFRLPKDEALINRMGFNNHGVQAMVEQVKTTKRKNIIIGGNIGKNKITPNQEAVNDYHTCFEALFDYVDYFAVNVSSPNTPNLRELQGKEPLTLLLSKLQEANQGKDKPKPILLKIAPDLNEAQLQDIVEIIRETKLAGVIATNTTITRDHLQSSKDLTDGAGGLSGEPIKKRSTEVIRFLREKLGPAAVIIGVGGINSPESAIEKLDAGADLIQVYTGLVYEGPSLIKKIKQALV